MKFTFIYFFFFFFFFNDTATTEIYTGWYTLSLHDALPILYNTFSKGGLGKQPTNARDKHSLLSSTPRSEEQTSELQSHHPISYAVFCLKKKKKKNTFTYLNSTQVTKKINIT